MTEIQHKRFLRLIEFLEDPESFREDFFDLGVLARDPAGGECPTIGCAIGWTPLLFPEVIAHSQGTMYAREKFVLIWVATAETLPFDGAAERLFGIPRQVGVKLFVPDMQGLVNPNLRNCSRFCEPAEFAAMLRQYLALSV